MTLESPELVGRILALSHVLLPQRYVCPLVQCHCLFAQLVDGGLQLQLRHARDTLRREWWHIAAELAHAAVLGSELADQE